jgi:hypothetical protein
MVAHTCNPNYLGGRDQEDHGGKNKGRKEGRKKGRKEGKKTFSNSGRTNPTLK